MSPVMLAVDGDQLGSGLSSRFNHQLTTCDQDLFVRKPNPFAEPHSLVRRFQSGHAHDCRQNEVHLGIYGCLNPRTRPITEFRPSGARNARSRKPVC